MVYIIFEIRQRLLPDKHAANLDKKVDVFRLDVSLDDKVCAWLHLHQ